MFLQIRRRRINTTNWVRNLQAADHRQTLSPIDNKHFEETVIIYIDRFNVKKLHFARRVTYRCNITACSMRGKKLFVMLNELLTYNDYGGTLWPTAADNDHAFNKHR
jgi:hypothetical protein